MKKCDNGKLNIEILVELHVFSVNDYKKVIFGISSVSLSVSKYVPD
jgi:hypothetical protein